MNSTVSANAYLPFSAARPLTFVRSGLGILLLVAASHATAWAGTTDDSGTSAMPPAVTDWAAPEAALIATLTAYHAALTSGDASAAEPYVLTDDRFVMLEGRHSNWGWADYRDHHLAAELGDLSKVRFRLSFYRVRIDGSLGYATFGYEVLPKEGPEMNFGRGIATAILDRTADGWKLRHLHTS